MPVDQSLVGRSFPPTAPYAVTEGKVREFARAVGGASHGTYAGRVPTTFPIVLAFDAMFGFLDAEQIDLFRIVHGEQRFAYERPIEIGDVLTATLTVSSLRQIGGADIIGTSSSILDAAGELVCTTKATLIHTGATA
jgi:acyl dehydratase